MRLPAYPSYKPSGIEWLGEVPEHWAVRRLKDGGDLLAGAGFPHEYQWLQDEELQFYKVGDLASAPDGKTMGPAPNTISRKTASELRAAVILEGAIIYAKIGAALFLSRRRATSVPCCIDNNMTAFVPNKNKLSSVWSFYWLSILDFAEFANPGAVPSLSEGYQSTLPLLVPPAPEQHAIADFLDRETAKLDTLVAKKRALIETLQEKRSALISRTVTRGLPACATASAGMPADAAAKAGLDPHPKLKPSGIDWLGDVPEHWDVIQLKWAVMFQRGRDLPANEREEGDVPLVSSSGVSATHSKAAAKGPGIVTGRYGTIGQFYLVQEDYWPLNTTLYSIDLRGNEPRFLQYMLTHLAPLFLLNAVKSAVPGVDRNDIHPAPTSVPPAPEQRAIADYLDRETAKIDRLVAKVEEAIVRLQEYRSALITAAVTGKIDVRETARLP